VRTVQDMGWSGIQNGALLRRAVAEGFTVFVTVDQNLEHQQNVPSIALTVVILRARSNDIADLLPLMPEVRTAISSAQIGQIVRVG
jgi:hypothetical protein